MDDIEKDFIDKGYLKVSRNLSIGKCVENYLNLAMEMSIFWIPKGPVGDGRLYEYCFYFKNPNHILEFGERLPKD